MKAYKIHFAKNKETKNTIRYDEVPSEGQPSLVGSIYIQKWAANNATKLTVTIQLEE